MAVPISNVTRRVVYVASGTGPYNFTFEILAAGDVAVYKDDALLTITTDYTVTINANGTGSITLTASPTGATQIAIVGNRTIQRTTDFVTGGDFFANTVNDEMDQQTIFAQQNAEGLQRALQAPQTDPTTIDMTLPRASVRANKTLAFDSNGDPTTGEVIGDNRGNWASGTAYNKRDIVKDTSNGNIYYANTAHTSTGAQPISSNTDSAKWDLIVDNASAGASATAAAASASAAATSASNASTSATNAASSASTATTQASNASTSATNAANSATAAASSASTASTAATNAGNSATAAATSATNASNSASSASTSATNASNSATSAASSASTATTQASNAANSASSASSSASNASTSATNAANSATSASNAQTAAESARDQTLAAFDSFDDRYLGSKTSDPTLDNDGNALVAGALYFNSSDGVMKVYTGSAWVAAYVSGSGFLSAANNLSDVANATTARANLGAGTVTSVGTGTGLSGGPITSSGTLSLADTAVTAGSYTYASITVDAQGRLTAASSGASPSAFPAGTAMMFVQTAAPTGWTKSTTHNDKALRVVSGTASSGGSAAFTTAFGTPTVSGSVSLSGTVGATTLTTTQIPSHSHTLNWSTSGAAGTNTGQYVTGANLGGSYSIGSAGGGGSHDHSFSGSGSLSSATAAINVQYVDVIIATKD